MLQEIVKAVIGITAILSGWLLVQLAWRRVFPGIPADEDALVGRLGCHGCSDQTHCKMEDCSNEVSTLDKND